MTVQAQIPSSAVICMVIEAIFAFAVPLAAIIIWKIKSKTSIFPAVCGALTFVLFAQMLEGSVHSLILSSDNFFSNLMSTNYFLYALYGGLMAGIFEETGRYVTMKYVLKNYRSKSDAVSYGLGHGGIECMLVLGFNMIVNIAFSVLVNSGEGGSALLDLAGGSAESLESIVSSLSGVTPALAAAAIFERVCAMALQLGLSVVVFSAVKKNVLNYLLAAILVHALADFGVLMVSQYAGIYFAEAILAVFVAAAAYYVFKVKKGEV